MPTTQYNARRRYNDRLTYLGAAIAPPTIGRHYEIRAVEMDGKQIEAWGHGQNDCNLHRYTDQLNRPGSAEFSLSLYDSKGPKLKKYTEIQIWRDDVLDWWGVIVNIRAASGGRVVFNCQGVTWYLWRRYVGRADRTNICVNPDFENGMSPWIGINLAGLSNDTSKKKTGAQSAKLTASAPGVDGFVYQAATVTAGSVGELITVAAWFNITDAGYRGPAKFNRGLMLKRYAAGVDKEVSEDDGTIDDDTPRGVWQRRETTVHMPRNVTENIEWRGYGVNTIHWDSFTVTKMESISFYDTEQATIFSEVVKHFQDSAYNKNDVKIGTQMPATGVRLDWHSQFAEHQDFRSIVDEFTGRANGFDIAPAYSSDGKTRYLASYYPKKGTYKSEYALTLDSHGGTIANYNYEDDGERSISSMTILGEGDGPDREEGGAVDTAIYNGLILEDVEAAPTGTDIASLDPIAEERLRARKRAENLSITVNIDVKDMTPVLTGDSFPVYIDDGWTQILGTPWRVVSKTTAPHSDNVTLELNPA